LFEPEPSVPVNPSDFLRALVLVVTERLQRGEDTSLPGVGTWSAPTDPDSGRVVVRFAEGQGSDPDSDVSLAREVAAEIGATQAEISPRIEGFARAVREHLRETGSVLLPGIGRLTGRPGRVAFRAETFFTEAVDWDRQAGPPATVPTEAEEAGPEIVNPWVVPDDAERDEVRGGGPEPEPLPDEPWEPSEAYPEFAPPRAPRPEPVERVAESGDGPRRPMPPAPAPSVAARRSRPVARRSRRMPPLPLVIAVLVVAGAAVVIALLRGGGPPETASRPAPQDTSSVGLTAATPADTSALVFADTVTSGAPSGGLAEPVTGTTAEASRPAPPPAEEAIRPAPAVAQQDFDTSTAGYTLVVASTVVESDALAGIQRYRQLGLPAAVLAYEDDGSVRYRLAVGLYESAAAADRARKEMADRLPAGTWVRRIRP
jgi:nucleoid DNA-binding protein